MATFIDTMLYFFFRLMYLLRLDRVFLASPSDHDLARKLVSISSVAGGLAGTVSRLQLDVIVKRPQSTSASARMHCRATGQWREAKFYEQDFSFHECLPKVFFTWYSPLLGDFVIATERIDGDVLKVHLGNQRNVNGIGAPKRFFLGMKDDVLLKALFIRTAEMHGSRWNDPSLLQQKWLKGVNWYAGQGKQAYVGAVQWAKSLMVAGLERRKSAGPELVSSKLLGRLTNWLDLSLESGFAALQSHLKNPLTPACLHHGDFHAGNIMVTTPNNGNGIRFVFLDFSEVGVFDPTFDLCQILISDVEGARYPSVCRGLVAAWHSRLNELVPDLHASGFTEEYAFRSMLRAGVQRWTWLLAALIGLPQVSDQAVEYFAHNLQCWIDLFESEVHDDQDREIKFVKV